MNQRADPNEDVYYSCSVLCTIINYYGAARRSAIEHAVIVVIFTGGGVHGAGSDLCHGLKERIDYNY